MTWLASYPKSGNTWLRLMLARLLQPDVPWSLQLLQAIPIDHAPAAATARVVKTHAQYRPAVHRVAGADVVYLVRDPRDVALSMAAFYGCTQARAAELLRGAVLGDGTYLGSWSAHVQGWLDARVCGLVLAFERLRADPVAALRQVAGVCGLPAQHAEHVVRECAFDRCREAEARDGFAEASPHAPFFRDGRAGQWRTALEPAVAAEIARDHGRAMWLCGYED
jgi:hypothetical protein